MWTTSGVTGLVKTLVSQDACKIQLGHAAALPPSHLDISLEDAMLSMSVHLYWRSIHDSFQALPTSDSAYSALPHL